MISFRAHYEYKPWWRGGGLIVEVACVILSAAVGGWVLVVSPVQRPSWPRLAPRAVKTRGHRSSPELTQRRPPGAKYTWCMDVEGPAEVVTLPMKSVYLCISYATF